MTERVVTVGPISRLLGGWAWMVTVSSVEEGFRYWYFVWANGVLVEVAPDGSERMLRGLSLNGVSHDTRRRRVLQVMAGRWPEVLPKGARQRVLE